jgi:Fusaric acid resistance protein-like
MSPREWLPVRSTPAALRAVRATIVVAGLFAFTDQVVGNLQVAIYAALGSFATLVLSSFAGTRRDKLIAHAALALAGSALLSIGTAVSSSTLLAALVTVPVAFTVVFAGVLGPNAASGMLGAMLSYVLSAASPGTVSMIPDRLAGWWLASIAGTIAVLALSPRAPADRLRAAVARMSRSLADQIRAALAGESDEQGLEDCIAAKHDLLALFTSTPFRPLGLAAPDQALANAIELLEWCTSLILDALREHNDLRAAAPVDRALLDGAAGALLETAAMFEGARELPDLRGLEALREASLGSVQDLSPAAPGFRHDAQIAFHSQAIATAVLAAGADAAVAERIVDSTWLAEQRLRYAGASSAGAPGRLASAAGTAARHASVRSVWFINSVRAALALGAAVAIADLSSVQHGFWVVLGTLSVLRSNAASTGATALRALGGTVIGFVIGGALLLAIGAGTTVLWVVLPIAVFIAAYAPGTAPFAVGQAAFTVTVAVLFNLLAPVGWKIGFVRVEDVAIGCGVSLLVGAMFWPRGVAAVVGDDLADAFRSGAGFLTQGVRWTSGLDQVQPNGATAAVTAGLRLDEALRGFLAEQGSKRIHKQELWRLVGGTLRLRLTAQALARLPPDPIAVREARDAIDRRAGIISDWYLSLAEQLDRPRVAAISPLVAPTLGPDTIVGIESGSHYGVWLCEHLDHLADHLDELIQPAYRIAELRRAPWWR